MSSDEDQAAEILSAGLDRWMARRVARVAEKAITVDLVTYADDDVGMADPITRTELDARFSGLRADMATGFAELRGEMRTGFAELRSDMHKLDASLKTWMIVTVIGMMIGFGGLFLSVTKPPAAAPAQQPIVIYSTPPPTPSPPASH